MSAFPYLTVHSIAVGSRVQVSVSVSGPVSRQGSRDTTTCDSFPGATAIGDTWAAALKEAICHPETQALFDAFAAGPIKIDCYGHRIKELPHDPPQV